MAPKFIRIIIIILLFLIILYSNCIINNYSNMMPRLTPDKDAESPPSIYKIFNNRELYIKDIKIKPKYIKYIKPINKKEEKKYKKRYLDNETIEKIYLEKDDKIDYKEFSKLALEEKLIDNSTIEYNNTPYISIIMPSYNNKKYTKSKF